MFVIIFSNFSLPCLIAIIAFVNIYPTFSPPRILNLSRFYFSKYYVVLFASKTSNLLVLFASLIAHGSSDKSRNIFTVFSCKDDSY
ncbi:MAG: hypothetical protein ACTS8Y_00420 [Arsenophonus sp. ER-EMS1-MAG3]